MDLSLARALRLRPYEKAGRSASPASSGPVGSLTAAFVGAGGKTTAMFQLARELPPPVLLTTTTHIGAWQTSLADKHIVAVSRADLKRLPLNGLTLITGTAAADGRFGSVSRDVFLWLHDAARNHQIPLLIEADGSRQKPLKAPAAHEPEIPDFVDMVVVVAGLSALGRPLAEESVHRSERFALLSGLAPGQPVTPDALIRVLIHPEGGLQNIPSQARRIALLNQADGAELQGQSRFMAIRLLEAYDAVLVASLQAGNVHAVHERTAGIVLAAGASTRLGRSKQLLDWHGESFVRAVTQNALAAGLDPVVVVAGFDAPAVEAALESLPVTIAHNSDWESGQATSIRAGLGSLASSCGSVVFLLADQPQVTLDVIRALVDTHAAGLFPIVAPLVMMERRANPVLFDRETFSDLMALQGDVGGRAIFSKYHVEYMPWHDERLLLDVDTEADYRRLLEGDTL